ncbi:FAD binding domain-containing protein [Afifella marina]|uniref:Xanthine dehydrogenase YagS FAD-binding subunit n=1 Tax=Afifella marina DSM 2698 TaxID=1120955 RepID=A0A1G5MFT9_AFIMA|nr:xanthine dehydrogenase family protein subunit M [Afifella marina]MBK1625506.1 molybdopterin dehydrogenase [Afifella marina DSM 2698]MBK1625545.1 molybdopterin dehydrogenase [Afifella marina]MBK5917332.1 molybdopterin dehydrogenase [Afifella marina]RAI23322.1 molybdopterin dehydrogenase [Afifella marina DSM 2698]SCZ23501.1 xanthine dehydrogenase YagS FAD-binding subunit [Afifella marina DSM 2698]
MNRFVCLRPTSVAEAVAAASEPGSAYLAAGTNLLDLMKGGVARPARLVDVTHLPGLGAIETLSDGAMRIGALVKNSTLAYDAAFSARFPAVAEALLSGASAQLRNAATVGGNLLQRTRCPYFYDTASACNKRAPGSGCDAIGGANEGHAVLGFSDHCIATHPSDFCVALTALGAIVEIEGEGGRRDVPITDFYRLPGDTPEKETVLSPGEMVVAMRLPADSTAFSANQRYLKVRERTSYAFAVVSAAAALRLEDGRIAEARLALGGVAAKPWRAEEAEARLAGRHANRAAFEEAADLTFAAAKPSGDNSYKITLGRRLVTRALLLAAAGTPDHLPALPASPFAETPAGVLPEGVAHV